VTPTPIIYTIRKGDTLLSIARQYGLTVRAIQEANGIDDPRRLHVGQEIAIPLAKGRTEPTIMPTPTPVALQIRGLGFFWTPVGSLWCLGEVVNLLDGPAEEIQVQVSLHDDRGQLLALGAAFTQLDILVGGGRSPFAILFASPPTSFAQYQARVLSGIRSTHLGPRYPDLLITEDFGGQVDQNNYQVRGRVQNTGQAEAEKVAVIVTLYDAENHVVGARTVGITPEVLLPGAVAPFEIVLTPLGPVARHQVAVQGWWVGYQIPGSTDTPAATAAP
jgi:LysM repeat protein